MCDCCERGSFRCGLPEAERNYMNSEQIFYEAREMLKDNIVCFSDAKIPLGENCLFIPNAIECHLDNGAKIIYFGR